MVKTTSMFFNFINKHLDFARQRSYSDFYCCNIKSQKHKTTLTFTGSTKQVGSDFTSPPDFQVPCDYGVPCNHKKLIQLIYLFVFYSF